MGKNSWMLVCAMHRKKGDQWYQIPPNVRVCKMNWCRIVKFFELYWFEYGHSLGTHGRKFCHLSSTVSGTYCHVLKAYSSNGPMESRFLRSRVLRRPQNQFFLEPWACMVGPVYTVAYCISLLTHDLLHIMTLSSGTRLLACSATAGRRLSTSSRYNCQIHLYLPLIRKLNMIHCPTGCQQNNLILKYPMSLIIVPMKKAWLLLLQQGVCIHRILEWNKSCGN